MSESDDTDDLLLIPPDLFTNQIELAQNYLSSDPYYNIVDSLITQVHVLEDKVKSITQSESDLRHSDSDNVMDSRRKYSSTDDLLTERENYGNTSAFSTPQKPRVVYRRREEATPRKPRRMLEDIEKFINGSVLADRRFGGDNLRKNEDLIKNVKTNGNKLIGEFRSDLNTESEFASNGNTERDQSRNARFKNGQDANFEDLSLVDAEKPVNVEEKNVRSRINFGRRLDRIGEIDLDAMLDEIEERKTRASSGIKFLYANPLDCSAGNTDSALADKSASGSSSSESTQTTAYNRCQQKIGAESRLMSLSELWGRNGKDSYKEKLQEERLRRQHCEELIRELQTKVLELQERVAVALKVDEAKDGALSKFQDAWEKMIFQYRNLDSERLSLENENKELRERRSVEIAEYSNKLKKVEEELREVIDLGRADKDRHLSAQEENSELKKSLSRMESDLKEAERLYNEQLEKNRAVNEILAQKEIEINEHKTLLSESRKEVCHCKEAIDVCQTEFTQMKRQYLQLEQILDSKQKQINGLESQNRAFLNDNENLKLIQRNLQEELIRLRDSTEKTKMDLRNFYQDQVEIVVRDKLREFQAQLDKTESSLQEEIKSREMNVAKTAASHIHQLTEKHNLEVNLLEEKHREEVKLYQVQLTQSQQQLEQMGSKLKKLTDGRNTILQQLKRVLEAQWNEALKIVNEGKSPVNVHDGTMDRLHHLKTKSYSNLEEVLSDNKLEENAAPGSSASSAVGEFNFNITQTPVTSKRNGKGQRQIENDLQNYVQMLLSKQSDNPEKDNSSDERMVLQDDAAKYKQLFRKGMKPPWK